MVCAVEKIEISTLFPREGRKCVQDARKSNFTAKCPNTFDAHYSSMFIITSVVIDIRDDHYLWPGGAERVFSGDHWNFSSSLYAVFPGKN